MKWTNVDPKPANFQNPIHSLQVVHQVVRRVDEKAGDEAVPLVALPTKHFDEFTSGHCKVKLVRVTHFKCWTNIRYLHLEKGILVALEIIKVMDVRV